MVKTLFKSSASTLSEKDLFKIAAQAELAKVNGPYDQSDVAAKINKAYETLLLAAQV